MTLRADANAPPPVEGLRPHFSVLREAKGFIFVSGQLPFGPEMRNTGKDVAEQTQICLGHIARILRERDLDLSDVVKTTVWLARVEDFPAFNRAYAEAFNGMATPARSTVRADLMVPGALVEIEAIAKLPG